MDMAEQQNLQGVVDTSFASAGNIVGGDAGQQIAVAGQAANQLQRGNLQGALGSVGQVGQVIGNEQVSNVFATSIPVYTNFATGNVSGAVDMTVKQVNNPVMSELYNPAKQVVNQVASGNISDAVMTTTAQGSQYLGAQEGQQLNANMGAFVGFTDAL